MASLREMFRLLRPHQWGKNILVYLPVILGHAYADSGVWIAATGGFIALSLVASALYVLNDAVDVADDRTHPVKKHRPLAAGTVTIPTGLTVAAISGAAGAAVGWLAVGWQATALLGGYGATTAAYSLRLKAVPLLDIFILAGLYVFRVVFGGIITGIGISNWLLAMSLFLFLSLAAAKRHVEMKSRAADPSSRRPYTVADVPFLQTLGLGSGLVASALTALYVSDTAAREVYASTTPLWAGVPLLLFWICRVWLLTERGQMNTDPLVFAYRDPVSYAIAVLLAGCFLLAGPL